MCWQSLCVCLCSGEEGRSLQTGVHRQRGQATAVQWQPQLQAGRGHWWVSAKGVKLRYLFSPGSMNDATQSQKLIWAHSRHTRPCKEMFQEKIKHIQQHISPANSFQISSTETSTGSLFGFCYNVCLIRLVCIQLACYSICWMNQVW